MLRRLFPRDPREVGHDPDYRYSFANERTFLAWLRTALALAAGGFAALELLSPSAGIVLGVTLLALGFVAAASASSRWAANERALRTGAPLPRSILPTVLTLGIALAILLAAVIWVWERVA